MVGEILYAVLLGAIAVWAANVFGLWERWQTAVEDWFKRHGR